MMARPKTRRKPYKCMRCGYQWLSRYKNPDRLPKKCPHCYSKYWYTQRIRQGDFSRCGLHAKLSSMARRLKHIEAMTMTGESDD